MVAPEERRLAISDADVEAVLAVNRRFYDAFESQDMNAMSEIWEHSERVVCNHPGWARLRGWSAVAASWFAIFQNDQRLQFVLTDEEAVVVGDAAWVTIDENLIDHNVQGTVSAVNIFIRADGEWVMTAHLGTSVMPRMGGGDL